MRKIKRVFSCGKVCLLSLALLPGMSGCSSRPEGAISEKEMVSLMADMQLAEAYSDVSHNGPQLAEERQKLAKSVLEKHGVTQQELDSTLAWYGRNLDEYSDLFAKVDEELRKRKKSLLKLDVVEEIDQADILWPYPKNALVSNLGDTEGWIVSIDNPALQTGDMLEWTMHLNKATSLSGVLGVDYSDGSAEAVSSMTGQGKNVGLKRQTDPTKTDNRLYRTRSVKESGRMPVFGDSITLRRISFDSLEYKKYRNQKKYGVASPRVIKTKEQEDSIKNALREPEDSIVRINIATGEIRNRPGEALKKELEASERAEIRKQK